MRFRLLLLALASAGCTSTPGGPNATKLAVEYSWATTRACSNVSPEIKVYNVPAGTTRLKIELVDVDSVISNHGGGEVEYRGPTVAEGALKQYRGPCPAGATAVADVKYEFRVSALSAAGAVLAYGSAVQAYVPPKMLPGRKI